MIKFPFLSGIKKSKLSGKIVAGLPGGIEDHSVEIEQFHSVLDSFGATHIEERLKILTVFLSTEEHMTIDELLELVTEKNPELKERDFLQETMELFCQFGFAQAISFETHETRYEHHHLGAHHDHFICTRCGKIEEFADPYLEKLQIAIARDNQFYPLQHKMEIYGICAECMGQRDKVIPLHMAMRGERVRIVQLTGDRAMQTRLASMGLTVDNCLEVLSTSEAGFFIIAFKGTRMALGKDITENIMVTHSCAHDTLDEMENE